MRSNPNEFNALLPAVSALWWGIAADAVARAAKSASMLLVLKDT
jgi:hypothetical protein